MRRQEVLRGYLYVLPLLAAVALISLYPAVQVAIMSLQDIELSDMSHPHFAGLDNFRSLFSSRDPNFASILRITMEFVFGSVFLHVLIGLGLALLLNLPWVRAKSLFRNSYMLPWIAAGIIVGYTWSFLFEPRTGLLNYSLGLLHLPAQGWTSDERLALPSIILANVWRGVPYSLIIQTSGLQSINPELYEAAYVDGAGPFQRLSRITLPLIREFILLNLILDTGLTFQVFDTIFAMTAGGPLHRTETFSIYMYNLGFTFGNLGQGSAVGVILLAISLAIAFVYIRFFRPGRLGA